MMRVDDVHAINAYNQGAGDSVTAKGGDGMFTAKSPRHGCLLQNPMYAIDLCLRLKLSKEVSLTRDGRLRGDGVDSGATVAAAGGADDVAAAGGVAKKEVYMHVGF